MAMTLRPDDLQTEVLRDAAERAGKSMHAFILDAALEAARDRTARRDALIGRIRGERRDVLDRLGR